MRIDSNNFDSAIKEIINDILPGCKALYIRVGYFYFSGFSLIAKAIEHIDVKILVGLSADKKIEDLVSYSKQEIQKLYFRELLHNVDEKEILDKTYEQDAFQIFKKKIENGSLEIRQQLYSDHAKEYIFELEDKFAKVLQSPGQTLAGSSNTSLSGFINQAELNHLFKDKEEYKAAKNTFNEKWKSSKSVELINKDNIEEFQKNINNFHFCQKPSPYNLFVRVLDEYFKDRNVNEIKLPKEITDNEFTNLKYQRDAITKGLDILNEHNGVLIADVVGLGKSIIASSIAFNINLPTYVICPPHLKSQWEDYLFKFNISSKIFTTGKIQKALDEDFQGQRLIIIDEVHKFRNDETQDYLKLYQLCHSYGSNGKRNKVILLSATPFNNEPKDTFSLIKLFQIPNKSTIQTIENLSEYFEILTKDYNSLKTEQDKGKRDGHEIYKDFKKIGEKIRSLISPIMIRRSRIDLKHIKAYKEDLEKQKISFPEVNDPILLEYELGQIREIYEKTLKLISPFSDKNETNYNCSRYKPITYVKSKYINEIILRGGYDKEDGPNRLPSEQQNIADFIKRLLVRRFESSSFSFFKTLNKIITSNEMIIKYYENLGFIPVYKKGQLPDFEEIFDLGSDDTQDIFDIDPLSQEDLNNFPKLKKLEEKGVWFIKKEELNNNYITDLKNDLKILNLIKKDWEIINSVDFADPKIIKFKDIITQLLLDDPKRKIIVFSEFSDTANFLFNSLKDEIRVIKYTSAESANSRIKDVIRKNFDASFKNQEDDFDVLVATDSISEGFNLHRAGSIFNYDIPYNPTRIVQRFGRINRINKKMFDLLYIYNFFPTEIGEKETGIKRITDLKKLMFNSIFGDDTKTLNKYEDLQSYFIDTFKELNEETISPESYFENIIYNLRNYEQKSIIEANQISRRVKLKRLNCAYNGIVSFSKKGDVPKFIFLNRKNEEFENLTDVEFLKIFEAEKSEKYVTFDRIFDNDYEKIKKIIFKEKKVVTLSKKILKIVKKLELIIQSSNYKNYFNDLLIVLRDLNSLTPLQVKLIERTGENNFDKKIDDFLELIPHNFLKNLIRAYKDINLKKESLIITEQLND